MDTEVQIKLFSLRFFFSISYSQKKKVFTNFHPTCTSLFLSTVLHHLATLCELFLMNICPTLVSSAPISLSLVVLHPAIRTFLCASSYLSFSTIYLPFPLCFHTLFSSIFPPFLLITSKTSLLILLSPTGPSSVSTLSPSFG